MSEENGNILDLGSIDFTPDWAKKDAGVSIGKVRPERRGEVQGGPGGREDRKMPGGRKSFGGLLLSDGGDNFQILYAEHV